MQYASSQNSINENILHKCFVLLYLWLFLPQSYVHVHLIKSMRIIFEIIAMFDRTNYEPYCLIKAFFVEFWSIMESFDLCVQNSTIEICFFTNTNGKLRY